MKSLQNLLHKCTQPLRGVLKAAPVEDDAADLEPIPLLRRRPKTLDQAPPKDTLKIACPDPTAEDAVRDSHLSRAQFLARQERWEDLSEIIRTADTNREMTPGSMPVAELLAYGARADVISAAEHALITGYPEKDAPLLAGIEALEHVLAEHPRDHVIAAIVAQSHMDIGWAWRGNGWDTEVPDHNREVFIAHFDRARDILSGFCSADHQSPLLASTCCALLGSLELKERTVADRYEALIDLNPHNPRPMRALGSHMLPRWYGSHEELELEARRTAARTEHVWGAGGYTWVQFDAIACDEIACAQLDVEYFVDGLHDILERCPDPYTTNLLAAYCANAIGQSYSGNDETDHNRSQIADCAGWIVREHLTELHPMVWAHAAHGFDNNLRVYSPARFAASGREDAVRIITSLFSREIAAGKQIVFVDTPPMAQAG